MFLFSKCIFLFPTLILHKCAELLSLLFLNWVEINLFSFILSQNILFKTSYFSKKTAFKIEKQCMGFSGGTVVEESACQWRRWQENRIWSLAREDPLQEEMATYSSIPAWKIPWTEEPGELQFKGSQRIKYNWVTKHTHINNQWVIKDKKTNIPPPSISQPIITSTCILVPSPVSTLTPRTCTVMWLQAVFCLSTLTEISHKTSVSFTCWSIF